MSQILNLTPHDINIVDEEGNVCVTFPTSGEVLRLSVTTSLVDDAGLVRKREVSPLVFKTIEEYEDLYDEDGNPYPSLSWSGFVVDDTRICGMVDGILVSAQVAVQLKLQGDCPFEVYTVGDTVKDSNGAIIGTKFLVLN